MLRVEIWIASTLFAAGVIVAMTYLNFTDARSIEKAAPSIADARISDTVFGFPKTLESEVTETVIGHRKTPLQLGDRYLVAGNYALALDNYYDSKESTNQGGTAILLREALCCEKQHQYELAQNKYHRTITGASSENHLLLGIVGFARCLTMTGKQAEALEILADQTLKIDQYETAPAEIRAQLVFHFANVLQSMIIERDLDLIEPTGVAFEGSSPRPELFLSVVDQPSKPLKSKPTFASKFSIQILQQPSNSLNVTTASISAKLEPVMVSIAQIAAAAQLELFVSQRAQEIIQDRSKTIELRAGPLSSVLDRLLVAFDLIWYQVDSELYVVDRQELDPSVGPNQFWFGATRRAFRRFELDYPDDSRRHASLLSRANLNLIEKKYDAAAIQYQELTQAHPEDEVLAKLFFNQAKLQLLLDREEEARRFLYLAVDQTLTPNIESSSYCLLGANHLSNGDLENAIKVSRRALATAVNAKQRRIASLNLARAYLLTKDPFSANDALFRNRNSYDDSSSKPIASMLGAFSRFIGVSDEKGIRTARNRLLSAVAMIPDKDYQSFADCYFASQAYEQLGFRNKAVDKLILALSKPDVGQWQRQIMFELAVLQERSGRSDEATATFRTLVETEDRWSSLALKELAQIFANTDQTELCIDTCKKLWQTNLTDEQKRFALQLLGFAYQKQGEHHSAALCFAGILPKTF